MINKILLLIISGQRYPALFENLEWKSLTSFLISKFNWLYAANNFKNAYCGIPNGEYSESSTLMCLNGSDLNSDVYAHYVSKGTGSKNAACHLFTIGAVFPPSVTKHSILSCMSTWAENRTQPFVLVLPRKTLHLIQRCISNNLLFLCTYSKMIKPKVHLFALP